MLAVVILTNDRAVGGAVGVSSGKSSGDRYGSVTSQTLIRESHGIVGCSMKLTPIVAKVTAAMPTKPPTTGFEPPWLLPIFVSPVTDDVIRRVSSHKM